MHELSLAESIFNTISEYVKTKATLTAVHVSVGPLSGVNCDCLEFGFSSLAELYGYPNARLVVRRTSSSMQCEDCGRSYECTEFDELCPGCGSLKRTIMSGKEFTLDSIEVEE
jgi:hydrogenase nickel incorporation protein HypA/HybF